MKFTIDETSQYDGFYHLIGMLELQDVYNWCNSLLYLFNRMIGS